MLSTCNPEAGAAAFVWSMLTYISFVMPARNNFNISNECDNFIVLAENIPYPLGISLQPVKGLFYHRPPFCSCIRIGHPSSFHCASGAPASPNFLVQSSLTESNFGCKWTLGIHAIDVWPAHSHLMSQWPCFWQCPAKKVFPPKFHANQLGNMWSSLGSITCCSGQFRLALPTSGIK